MKKIVIAFLLVVVFAVPVIACPLPADVKVQKVTTNNSNLSPTVNAALMTRLRSQLRRAFNCDKQSVSKTTGKNVVNVDLVEIIHEGVTSTRVNISTTDYGFFSARVNGGIYSGPASREQFEEAMKWIVKDISESVCK